MVLPLGGAIGLTENDGAFHRWIVACPEIAKQVEEFEKLFSTQKSLVWQNTMMHQGRLFKGCKFNVVCDY